MGQSGMTSRFSSGNHRGLAGQGRLGSYLYGLALQVGLCMGLWAARAPRGTCYGDWGLRVAIRRPRCGGCAQLRGREREGAGAGRAAGQASWRRGQEWTWRSRVLQPAGSRACGAAAEPGKLWLLESAYSWAEQLGQRLRLVGSALQQQPRLARGLAAAGEAVRANWRVTWRGADTRLTRFTHGW